MLKRTNNRAPKIETSIIRGSNIVGQNINKYRKCAYHLGSYGYVTHAKKHDEIFGSGSREKLSGVDMQSSITIKTVFHFLAPKGSYNKDIVFRRTHDILLSVNEDFNSYGSNQNTMNGMRYKSIINQIFTSNMDKQNIYLSSEYVRTLPSQPSNIAFELGEIYYYPINNRLSLAKFNDSTEVELELQAIRNFINDVHASAIEPSKILNIWVIDMTDTGILGFSNFPWEPLDDFHGIIIHRRCFFPEDYGEKNFAGYKTFTHEIGHYLGLLHVFNTEDIDSIRDDITYDPTDKISNRRLHEDRTHNPLFMNFMDYTYDKYVAIFTKNQIQKMRYVIFRHRPNISSGVSLSLPSPTYNPDTDSIVGTIESTQVKYDLPSRSARNPKRAETNRINKKIYNNMDSTMQNQQIPNFQPMQFNPEQMQFDPEQQEQMSEFQQSQFHPEQSEHSRTYDYTNQTPMYDYFGKTYQQQYQSYDNPSRGFQENFQTQYYPEYQQYQSHNNPYQGFQENYQQQYHPEYYQPMYRGNPGEIPEIQRSYRGNPGEIPETQRPQQDENEFGFLAPRIYPRFSQANSGTRINTLDPNYKPRPTNLAEIARTRENNSRSGQNQNARPAGRSAVGRNDTSCIPSRQNLGGTRTQANQNTNNLGKNAQTSRNTILSTTNPDTRFGNSGKSQTDRVQTEPDRKSTPNSTNNNSNTKRRYTRNKPMAMDN